MEIFMVSLADRDTGQDQRVLATVPSGSTEEEVRDFILTPGLTSREGVKITLTNPRVIGIRKLRVKHTPRHTNMAMMEKTPA